MRLQLRILPVFLLVTSVSFTAIAEDLPINVYNFLRIQYDDNVFTTSDDVGGGPVESAAIVEQLEFLLDSRQGNTYYGLRYSPAYTYYDDRPDDDDDWSHQWDLILEQDFSPRTSAQLKHTLRYAEESELVEEDVTFRNNNDYLYNLVTGSFTTQLAPEKTSLRVNASFSDFAYQEDIVAEISDYTQFGGGFDIIQTLTPQSTLAANFGYHELDYDSNFRDAEVYRAAATYYKAFSPTFQGTLSLGWEQQNSEDPVTNDIDAPYANLSLVWNAAQATTLTAGGGYGIEKSPVNTFSAQERARIFARLRHDLSAALGLLVEGNFTTGSFDTDSATSLFDPAVNSDGDEDTIRFLTALTYRIDVRNSLELAWRYTELESDVRPGSDYDRNRYYLGWKYSL